MKATKILMEEHEIIRTMLRILTAVSLKMEGNYKVGSTHLNEIVDFIEGFADKYHHAKEEDLLFKEMEVAGIPCEGGPIAVMLHDHEVGRSYVRAMKESIARIQDGSLEDTKKFINNGKYFATLLEEHILKENNILYPIADAHLSHEQQNKLHTEFKLVEEKYINNGNHKELLNIVNKLKEIYLKN